MIEAFGTKIIIKKEKDSSEKHSGGILLPDSVQSTECERAEVVSVGAGRYRASTGVRVGIPGICTGMKVFVNKFAGQKLTYEDQEYTVVMEEDIVAIEPAKES